MPIPVRALVASLFIHTIAQVVQMTGATAGEAEIASLRQLFSSPRQASDQLAASFVAEIPAERLSQIVEQMVDSLGAPRSIVQEGDRYAVRTNTHEIPTRITLDREGKISGLLFETPVALTASLQQTLDELAGLADTVAYVLESDGEIHHDRNADLPLAVGSAFKLGVLKALADDIERGRRRWDDVVRLEEIDRSLPTGDLRLYPAGSPFTLHTLAAEMIAHSDNTATDALIRVLGTERIAGILGIETLLTTRALFQLKADRRMAEAYLSGSPAGRQTILTRLSERELPTVAEVATPYVPDIEWMIPARRLCALATSVAAIDVFAINPGPIRKGNWRRIAYKGGSEMGVLNLTAALTGKNGRAHCLSVTFNSRTPIDETTAVGLFARAAAQLADET